MSSSLLLLLLLLLLEVVLLCVAEALVVVDNLHRGGHGLLPPAMPFRCFSNNFTIGIASTMHARAARCIHPAAGHVNRQIAVHSRRVFAAPSL